MDIDKYIRNISVAFLVAIATAATRMMRIDTAVSVIFLIALIISFVQLFIDKKKNGNGKEK